MQTMKYDFETAVDRTGIGNMIEERKPAAVRAAGLLSYWGAEFDFRTAPPLIDAVMKAAGNGLFGFTLPSPAYLDRVAWWFETQRRCVIRPEWILPTHGIVFSLATALRAFTNPGDGLIMMTPGYLRYRQAADRLGRKTVICPLILRGGRYHIDFDCLETAMAAGENRLLALCNPSNATGTVWSRQDPSRIAELAARHDVIVFSDEIFAEITFGDAEAVPYHSAAGEDARCVTATSLGKCFGLTGVNHANVVIPDTATRERFLAQRNADHYGSVDPFLHAALTGAYTEEGASWLSAMREYVWENYLFIDAFFRENLPSVSVYRPEGTYVLWIDFGGLGLGPEELPRFLLDEALFCLDEGGTYGGPASFMRMNISVPRREIERSLGCLRNAAVKRGLC